VPMGYMESTSAGIPLAQGLITFDNMCGSISLGLRSRQVRHFII
jgi:hypothetical protein